MRSYRNLIKSLPPRSVVFTFETFDPPTLNHQRLIEFTRKLARHTKSTYSVYTPQTCNESLSFDRKMHYLNIMFPDVRFKHINTFKETVEYLKRHYKDVIFVAESNSKLIKQCDVKVVELDRHELDIESSKLRSLATKGLFEEFKYHLPSTIRSIDARRLMNDIRENKQLDPIKEPVMITVDSVRERYFKGEIFNVGDLVESISGDRLEIIKRGTNNLVCKDSTGNTVNKWLTEVREFNTDK